MITSEQRAAWRKESKPGVKRGNASTWRDRSTMWCTRAIALLDALEDVERQASEGWAAYAAEQGRHAETVAGRGESMSTDA